ncbi:putative zinc-binding peptidase [Microbacterium sp. cx-55]|uniref:zinc-binding metallopeptidase family protein n=1 Tax=Microbacterium sp. cx-55 TaxID=2875948 RepID=UPI001CBFD566|nr:putative zinc-binding metallopeptidase [Microbacterium sp. cx-55]MBZ4486872.1 putative zinc-binding peptidase [Microbacterium sp. cx-55]UGB35797.1 putative zinc-binding peptidase [Microbacterium sp. cx-55]
MKAHRCRVCGNPLFFENTRCEVCGSALAYSLIEDAIVPLSGGEYRAGDGLIWHTCANRDLAACTWLTADAGTLCSSCALTRTRPANGDEAGLAGLVIAERAKRQLVRELHRLGVPLVRQGSAADPAGTGIAFDLLSDTPDGVVIGHTDGVITINLAETGDAYRERMRIQLDEPYRTVLGHLRHEIGHYVEWLLLEIPDRMDAARTLFGDERADYGDAVTRHYAQGPPDDWRRTYISSYATMHPYEDFAETWAHFLHIRDAVETAEEYGILRERAVPHPFSRLVIDVWLPLATGLNMVNRSLGQKDLYPFVITAPVLRKLDFVDDAIQRYAAESA